MKHILCFGDSNTWGYNPDMDEPSEMRYPEEIRWTGRLSLLLGEEWRVEEEGMCGRSTVFDDPLSPLCNGAWALPLCLRSHQPLDLIVFMLGTNDVRTLFHANVKEISRGMEHLIKMALSVESYDVGKVPQILLIAPPRLGKELWDSYFYGIYDEQSQEKLEKLPMEYRRLANQYGCIYLDAGSVIKGTGSDGVHLTPEGHSKLAEAVAEKILEKGRGGYE